MRVKEEIKGTIQRNNLRSTFLNDDDFARYWKIVCDKYSQGKDRYPLWEHLSEKKSFRNESAWRFISEFIGNDSCLLFTEKKDENTIIKMTNGPELSLILGDSFHFVFYITNDNCDYLLCFNDHDYLIGCGTAKKWIADKKRY
jgi:hypothetical protein